MLFDILSNIQTLSSPLLSGISQWLWVSETFTTHAYLRRSHGRPHGRLTSSDVFQFSCFVNETNRHWPLLCVKHVHLIAIWRQLKQLRSHQINFTQWQHHLYVTSIVKFVFLAWLTSHSKSSLSHSLVESYCIIG